MKFKARMHKGGFIEIVGLEEYLKKALKTPAAGGKGSKGKSAKKAEPSGALEKVLAAWNSHPKKHAFAKAGKLKDQLLRSLIPLYLVRKHDLEITSGVMSKFWGKHGVKYQAPNAAKALREHVGYARQTKTGRQITPNGVRYVEAAIAGKAPRRAA